MDLGLTAGGAVASRPRGWTVAVVGLVSGHHLATKSLIKPVTEKAPSMQSSLLNSNLLFFASFLNYADNTV